jgi:hypothetical protein
MVGFKIQQGVRPGGAETVNALVLVADHEEILAFRGQQLDDRVLDAGCVLRFIHADIRKALLKGIQHDGIFLQDGIGIGHLIVKVHQVPLPQGVPIPLNDFGQMVDLTVKLAPLPGGSGRPYEPDGSIAFFGRGFKEKNAEAR